MLRYLELHHFALLEHVVFEPGPGLNILTGETGAGKSLLLDALGAVSGGRTSRDVIRTGYDESRVEAVFDFIPSQFPAELAAEIFPDGLPEPDEAALILSREMKREGRGICRINGRIVPLARLRECGSWLLDIHGQNESQKIFQAATHLELLDRYGHEQIDALKQEYQVIFTGLRRLEQAMKQFGGSEQERARQLDLLRYQADEISGLKPRPHEDELLQKKRLQLSGSQKLEEALTAALDVLSGEQDDSGSAETSLARAVSLLTAVESFQDQMPDMTSRLKYLQEELLDVTSRLDQIRGSLDYRPELIEKIDVRLDRLFRLKKKYGDSLDEVIAFAEKAEEEISRLEAAEEEMTRLAGEQEGMLRKLEEAGVRLRRAREEVAGKLADSIGRELAELGMKNARFSTSFTRLAVEEARPSGLDQVEFLFSANLGEDLKPLARIASGGEASRIMLAIKVILAQAEPLQLLIFDEVDSGISGETAALVGQKLVELGRGSQVMCVTHTAQVAAMADRHFYLQKDVRENKTETSIRPLDEEAHLAAVARLLSGATDHRTALNLAQSLTEHAVRFKSGLETAR